MNRKNSTKQPPSGSRLRISTICRLVIALAVVKAAVLVSFVLPGDETADPVLPPSVTTYLQPGETVSETQPHQSLALDTTVRNSPDEVLPQAVPTSHLAPASPEPSAVAEAPQAAPSGNVNIAAQPPLPQSEAGQMADALASKDRHVMASAIADASAKAALNLPSLFGASIANAADLPALPDIIPPAPALRSMAETAQERALRPDETPPGTPPVPEVNSFISRDSAAQKQAELNRKEQELMALQQQMEARLGELHNLENRIQGMLHDANTAADSKFQNLISMYANMKPRVAAQALTSMDETVAVKILTGMKTKESGEILSYMEPRAAARLSEVMSKMQI